MKKYKIHTANGHVIEIEAEKYEPASKATIWAVFSKDEKPTALVNTTHVVAIIEI